MYIYILTCIYICIYVYMCMYVYINVNIYIFHSHKKPPSPPLSDSFISPCLLVLHRNFVGEIPFNHMGGS